MKRLTKPWSRRADARGSWLALDGLWPTRYPEELARPSMPNERQALEKYSAHAAEYDGTETDRVAPMRRAAIAMLDLRRGHTVLDVGCGTGLSFPILEDFVGPEGHVIGIDQSPDMLARARARIARHGWSNVALIEAPAAEAVIPMLADAALFHFTHDIMRTAHAVAHVVAHLKRGGRVVAIGIKWAPWWSLRVNLRVWRLARAYTTTLEGLHAPWSYLAEVIPDLTIEPIADGLAYLATGTKSV